MSEFTGTPGPWAEWQKDGAPHTTRIVSTVDNTIVAELNEWRTPWVSQAADNARLIAAAPFLLDTLKSIIAWQDEEDGPVTKHDLMIRNAARAAIQKATGE